jgi:hypothetical protein
MATQINRTKLFVDDENVTSDKLFNESRHRITSEFHDEISVYKITITINGTLLHCIKARNEMYFSFTHMFVSEILNKSVALERLKQAEKSYM